MTDSNSLYSNQLEVDVATIVIDTLKKVSWSGEKLNF